MISHQPPSESRFFQLDVDFHLRILTVLRAPVPGTVRAIDLTGALLRLDAEKTCEALETMVAAGGCFRLITFEHTFIFHHCARFLQIRDRFGPQVIQWSLAQSEQARNVQQTSVVGVSGMARKPVRTAPHGFESADPTDLAGQVDYFEQLWAHGEPPPASRPLGL